MLLYTDFVDRETSWDHIVALKDVMVIYGVPFSYYVDNHSIFRFVQGRDSFWRKHYKVTDESDPQWKQVLIDCNVKTIYALSPQAKGKIERPYGWLQNRIVRTCARERVETIEQGKEILRHEVERYNYRHVYSTTLEIPAIRYEKALKDKRSLFREFKIRHPYESMKDIFCLRSERTVNAYRKISINNLALKVNGAIPFERIQLRIVPDKKTGLAEIRFWCRNKLIDVQIVKNDALKLVHF